MINVKKILREDHNFKRLFFDILEQSYDCILTTERLSKMVDHLLYEISEEIPHATGRQDLYKKLSEYEEEMEPELLSYDEYLECIGNYDFDTCLDEACNYTHKNLYEMMEHAYENLKVKVLYQLNKALQIYFGE